MHTHITLCPHCHTRFRVTDDQLEQADGRVRCGSCLKAFQASNHFVTSIDPPALPMSVPDAVAQDATQDNNKADAPPLPQNNDSYPQKPETPANAASETPPQEAELGLHETITLPDEHIDTTGLYIPNIDATPPSIPVARRQPKRRHRLLWGILCLLLVVSVGVQYLIYNHQTLSGTSYLQPFYQQACRLLPCQPATPATPLQLTATNLLVRTTDTQPGTLLVDLLLYNQAARPLPFPRLELVFSDHHKKPLAAGIFKPHDYLGKDLDQLQQLPAHRQLHVSFRITDPGAAASHYSLHLLPAKHVH